MVFVETNAEHPAPLLLMLSCVLLTITHVPYFATGVAMFSFDLQNTPKAFCDGSSAQVMFFSYVEHA